VEFISPKRAGITFSPNDAAVDSFLQVRVVVLALLSAHFIYILFPI
jgi:hypothetical protein